MELDVKTPCLAVELSENICKAHHQLRYQQERRICYLGSQSQYPHIVPGVYLRGSKSQILKSFYVKLCFLYREAFS